MPYSCGYELKLNYYFRVLFLEVPLRGAPFRFFIPLAHVVVTILGGRSRCSGRSRWMHVYYLPSSCTFLRIVLFYFLELRFTTTVQFDTVQLGI